MIFENNIIELRDDLGDILEKLLDIINKNAKNRDWNIIVKNANVGNVIAELQEILISAVGFDKLQPMRVSVKPGPGRKKLDFTKDQILKTLARCKMNKSKAAKELGINRLTLYRNMKDLGLNIKKIKKE